MFDTMVFHLSKTIGNEGSSTSSSLMFFQYEILDISNITQIVIYHVNKFVNKFLMPLKSYLFNI